MTEEDKTIISLDMCSYCSSYLSSHARKNTWIDVQNVAAKQTANKQSDQIDSLNLGLEVKKLAKKVEGTRHLLVKTLG